MQPSFATYLTVNYKVIQSKPRRVSQGYRAHLRTSLLSRYSLSHVDHFRIRVRMFKFHDQMSSSSNIVNYSFCSKLLNDREIFRLKSWISEIIYGLEN